MRASPSLLLVHAVKRLGPFLVLLLEVNLLELPPEAFGDEWVFGEGADRVEQRLRQSLDAPLLCAFGAQRVQVVVQRLAGVEVLADACQTRCNSSRVRVASLRRRRIRNSLWIVNVPAGIAMNVRSSITAFSAAKTLR